MLGASLHAMDKKETSKLNVINKYDPAHDEVLHEMIEAHINQALLIQYSIDFCDNLLEPTPEVAPMQSIADTHDNDSDEREENDNDHDDINDTHDTNNNSAVCAVSTSSSQNNSHKRLSSISPSSNLALRIKNRQRVKKIRWSPTQDANTQ